MKRNYLRRQNGYKEVVSASEYIEIIKNGSYNIDRAEIIPPTLGGNETVRFNITYRSPINASFNITSSPAGITPFPTGYGSMNISLNMTSNVSNFETNGKYFFNLLRNSK